MATYWNRQALLGLHVDPVFPTAKNCNVNRVMTEIDYSYKKAYDNLYGKEGNQGKEGLDNETSYTYEDEEYGF